MFNLHLAYSIIFMKDNTSTISVDLLNGCMQSLDLVLKNLSAFIAEKNELNAMLVGNKILKTLI